MPSWSKGLWTLLEDLCMACLGRDSRRAACPEGPLQEVPFSLVSPICPGILGGILYGYKEWGSLSKLDQGTTDRREF